MKYLHSITEIKKEHCYDTNGSRPVRVFCNDLNYYVCKYRTGAGFPFLLFNEYIAARFLQFWNLPVPDFAFVLVNREHLGQTLLPYHFFDLPAFGSRFMGNFKEVDKFFLETSYIRKDNSSGRISFLKIALFDLWLCNEDRHYDNFNLLYNFKNDLFVPIDHAFCFNSSNLARDPYLISDNISILSTPFLNRFFDRNLQTKADELRLKIIKEFYSNVGTCYEKIDEILNELPSAWKPDPEFLRERLQLFFSQQWLKGCINKFTSLYFLNIR